MSTCSCECHGHGPYHPCSIEGGCGHLHARAERPDGACLTCPPPDDGKDWSEPATGHTVCDRCRSRLAKQLIDIAARYRRLNPRPGSTGEIGRGAPGFGSRSPAADHIVVMRDWRSKSHEVAKDGIKYVWDPTADHGRRLPEGVYGPEEPPGAYTKKLDAWLGADGKKHAEEEFPVRSVPFTLASLVDLVAEEQQIVPPAGRTVKELARWLIHQLDWVTRQTWVTEFADELKFLVRQLRPVTGDPSIHIGECPNTIDEGKSTRECGQPLYAPANFTSKSVIRCPAPACGRKWPRDDWDHLGQLMQDRRQLSA